MAGVLTGLCLYIYLEKAEVSKIVWSIISEHNRDLIMEINLGGALLDRSRGMNQHLRIIYNLESVPQKIPDDFFIESVLQKLV